MAVAADIIDQAHAALVECADLIDGLADGGCAEVLRSLQRVALCRFHHTFIHSQHWAVEMDERQQPTFVRPDGTIYATSDVMGKAQPSEPPRWTGQPARETPPPTR